MTATLQIQRAATGAKSHVSSEMTIRNGWPVSQSVWHAVEPFCSMTMSVEYWSKFAAFHRQWGRLHMSEKIFSSGTRTKKTHTIEIKKYENYITVNHTTNQDTFFIKTLLPMMSLDLLLPLFR